MDEASAYLLVCPLAKISHFLTRMAMKFCVWWPVILSPMKECHLDYIFSGLHGVRMLLENLSVISCVGKWMCVRAQRGYLANPRFINAAHWHLWNRINNVGCISVSSFSASDRDTPTPKGPPHTAHTSNSFIRPLSEHSIPLVWPVWQKSCIETHCFDVLPTVQ